MVCAPVRSIIPSPKLGDYLSVQAHKQCSISHLLLPFLSRWAQWTESMAAPPGREGGGGGGGELQIIIRPRPSYPVSKPHYILKWVSRSIHYFSYFCSKEIKDVKYFSSENLHFYGNK